MKTYDDIEIELLWTTPNPHKIISNACSITMKQELADDIKNIEKNLFTMNHLSAFEHVVFSFYIKGLSRSGVMQLTRHRMASFTVSSQHYQEYTKYPLVTSKSLHKYENEFMNIINIYKKMIDDGIPHFEARQILPNASSCNLMLTINLRSLINFMNLRLCSRNTDEILMLSIKMRNLILKELPGLDFLFNTDCKIDKCKQQTMRCKNGTNY